MVFGVGPAGTGKTYLAVAMAVSALLAKQVNRIILVRPAVEAGERLGFLPGTLQEKVDPYLRPLYDALYDLLDAEKVDRYLEKNVIEVAPLAFMRGRTLNDSFVILDEAQNTTSEQMKMFLTRLGFNSKAVITGDITQIDLPTARRSGLIEAVDILNSVEGLAFVYFDESGCGAASPGDAYLRTVSGAKGRGSRSSRCRCRWKQSQGSRTRMGPRRGFVLRKTRRWWRKRAIQQGRLASLRRAEPPPVLFGMRLRTDGFRSQRDGHLAQTGRWTSKAHSTAFVTRAERDLCGCAAQ